MENSAANVIAIIIFLGIPVCFICFVALMIYSFIYFRSEKFLSIKRRIAEYVRDCNELNAHIAELRNSYADMKKTDYGEAQFQNISRQNFRKKGLSGTSYSPNVYDCSRTVCDGARKQPFKYICKYFNVRANEETLSQFEEVLNNFSAAEEGKVLSRRKRDEILRSISNDIPGLIQSLFRKKLERELGFDEYSFDSLYFPTYSFRYVSSGGNSGTKFDVVMDIDMLERFVGYLSESVNFKKSVAGQRRLMTPKLRQSIKERDMFTCRNCGNSIEVEPNLLLEVDHIIPLSKGGITSEDNLQTLCWKCNRSKGAKLVF